MVRHCWNKTDVWVTCCQVVFNVVEYWCFHFCDSGILNVRLDKVFVNISSATLLTAFSIARSLPFCRSLPVSLFSGSVCLLQLVFYYLLICQLWQILLWLFWWHSPLSFVGNTPQPLGWTSSEILEYPFWFLQCHPSLA